MKKLHEIQQLMQMRLEQLSELQAAIRKDLLPYANGKNLKGNELVGWLGEIYIAQLFNGQLVSDDLEHDVVTPEGNKISVKTRKGWGSGWQQASAIPKIDGNDCPTQLAFVHLNDKFSIDTIWLFDWENLKTSGRFKEHIVRGEHRSFIFKVNPRADSKMVIYPPPSIPA